MMMKERYTMTKNSGFSLIELMIVVAIIGILSAIAVPAYRNHVLKSHRADAQTILLDLAARQERFIAQNNSYSLLISAATGLDLGRTTSREGYYDLTVGPGASTDIASSYLLTATAVGGQMKDTDCLTITFSSAGVKSGTTGECW
jgi:type IV pilus assembly protein PilE